MFDSKSYGKLQLWYLIGATTLLGGVCIYVFTSPPGCSSLEKGDAGTFSNWQSMIQLAIGLNLALYAYLKLGESAVERAKKKIYRYRQMSANLRQSITDLDRVDQIDQNDKKATAIVIAIKSEISRKLTADRYGAYFMIALTAIGFALMVYASFCPDLPISYQQGAVITALSLIWTPLAALDGHLHGNKIAALSDQLDGLTDNLSRI